MISSQRSRHKTLFSKSKNRAFSVAFAILLSISFMVADVHYHALSSVRHFFLNVVSPIQFFVDYPIKSIQYVYVLLGSKKKLLQENTQLRYQQIHLENQLQKYSLLVKENEQLKKLLNTSSSIAMKTMAADILAVETTPARHFMIINKGFKHGVFEGQVVLDAKGVVGQIIDIGAKTSTVLMISDSKSGVPIQNSRTEERAILMGKNDLETLYLVNLPKSSSIRPGDTLLTSGLGRRFPEGYPIGLVQKIVDIPGEDFIRVEVSPMALLNKNRLVLLLFPENEEAELSREITQRLMANILKN